jgi:LysR family glycine cleavage system transcriptional activator
MREGYIPTITELQAFSACARLGATTRAAQALNLTQSAVSRSVGTLEERLGVRLFHRVKQRLILSDAGRALYRDADRLLDDLRQAAMTVMAFGGHADVLRLAVLPTFGSSWLVPRLAQYRAIAPNLTFDISARLDVVDFETEGFDAAIQRGDHRPGGAYADVLMAEELVVLASPSLLGGRRVLPDEELARLPLLQQSTRPTLWLDWFRDAGLDSRTILRGARFQHFDMVVNAAVAGLGVALVPEVVARTALATGELCRASARRLVGDQPYTLIYPARSRQMDGFMRFRAWLLEQVREQPEDRPPAG